MTFIQIVGLLVMLFICVYSLIERICRCIEHCATARAYSKFQENGISTQMNNVEAGIIKNMEERKATNEMLSNDSQ